MELPSQTKFLGSVRSAYHAASRLSHPLTAEHAGEELSRHVNLTAARRHISDDVNPRQ